MTLRALGAWCSPLGKPGPADAARPSSASSAASATPPKPSAQRWSISRRDSERWMFLQCILPTSIEPLEQLRPGILNPVQNPIANLSRKRSHRIRFQVRYRAGPLVSDEITLLPENLESTDQARLRADRV